MITFPELEELDTLTEQLLKQEQNLKLMEHDATITKQQLAQAYQEHLALLRQYRIKDFLLSHKIKQWAKSSHGPNQHVPSPFCIEVPTAPLPPVHA